MPVVKQDKAVVDPLKPANNGGAKVDTQGKVDVKKGKEPTPVLTAPAPGDAPIVKQPPAATTPAIKVPALKTPDAAAPVIEVPLAKPKLDQAVTPPADTGKSTSDVPVTKQKAGDAPVPQDTQKNDQPKPTGQQPKDQNAKYKNPKDGKDKVKCDPNVETCPPAQ
ncbi:MAG: hypothetical protein ABJA10_08410 [Aestuariivirga sp.]